MIHGVLNSAGWRDPGRSFNRIALSSPSEETGSDFKVFQGKML